VFRPLQPRSRDGPREVNPRVGDHFEERVLCRQDLAAQLGRGDVGQTRALKVVGVHAVILAPATGPATVLPDRLLREQGRPGQLPAQQGHDVVRRIGAASR
jgi:hypothetical protein